MIESMIYRPLGELLVFVGYHPILEYREMATEMLQQQEHQRDQRNQFQ